MKRRAVWMMTILLPVMTACGDDQPRVVGTAHVLRVLESLESQQETVIAATINRGLWARRTCSACWNRSRASRKP